MGYFSNGTENEIYQEQWCSRCVHEGPQDGPGCPVMGIHFFYNYDQVGSTGEHMKLKDILGTFIPREGIRNGK